MSIVDDPDWTFHFEQVEAGNMTDLPDWTYAEIGTGTEGGPTTPGTGPAGTTGTSGWWDATQITYLPDGAALTTWNDISGSGNPLTGANSPIFYSSTSAHLINGLAAVRFTASSSVAENNTGVFSVAQPFTAMVIFQLDSVPSSGAQFMMSFSTSNAMWVSGAPGNDWVVSSNLTAIEFVPTDTHPHCLIGVWQGATSVAYLDGVPSTITNIGSQAASYAAVGNNGTTPTQPAVGRVGEAAFWPSALSATQILALHTYSQGKWGTP